MSTRLEHYRTVWKKKKILRLIYTSWYKRIIKDLSSVKGKDLELGSGTGNLKEFYPKVISSDIENCSWLDKQVDAHHLPFKKNELSNIIMIDVLHHLSSPPEFFKEAHRVLRKGGRIIIIEPFPTIFSWVVYKLFHPEPFIFRTDVFAMKEKEKQAWDSNQAIAYLLFFKHKKEFKKKYGSKFIIKKREKTSTFIYPLSGGFENKAIIGDKLIPLAKTMEKILRPLRGILAFRCYVILEKK